MSISEIFCFVLVAAVAAVLAWLFTLLYFRAQLVRVEERMRGMQGQQELLKQGEAESQKLMLMWQGEASRAREALARVEVTLAEERKNYESRHAEWVQAQEEWTGRFRALSAEALKSNNETFLQLAQSTLEKYQTAAKTDLERYQVAAKTDLDKRQASLNLWFQPVQETLSRFDSKLGSLERARIEAYSGLTQQISTLAQTQQSLAKALGTPRIRGRWGELQLKRVVEIAGMMAHCDFDEQLSVTSDAGKQLRPDLVVRLPGGKTIVVDAKTPMDAYLEAMETDDEGVRKIKMREHARAIRDHMTMLSQKSYWSQFTNSPELAVLFLPGENFFSAALEQEPSLIDQDVANTHIVIATPVTLIALLKVVAYGWQQEAIAQNAQAISELGRELHDRLGVLSGHWSKVGVSLRKAVESYNEAVASLERRVLVSARRFRELKSTSGKEIEEPEQVAVLPRVMEPQSLGELPFEEP